LITNLLFIFKEGIGGLIRTRVAGFVATITVAISLVLIGIFLIITFNLRRFVDHLRSRVELEVFLDDSLDEQKIQELADKISRFEGVENLTFISKEMAIYEYKNLFKDQQRDYFEALGYNPLPASFRIKLSDDYRNAAGAEKVFQYLTSIFGFKEEDIVYRREYLVLLEKYNKVAIAMVFFVGSIVCLSALLLVSNTIRLIISSKQRIIETMKLVGATRFFIQIPLYIQGIVQGLVGGIIAALFLYALIQLAAFGLSGFIEVNWRIYLLLVNLGVLLGLAASFAAIQRHL
jgi:cell division transport system permease protein